MTISTTIFSNNTLMHKFSNSPVLKVEGFDGYVFEELGVTDQFLENASVYFDRYTNPNHFRNLYKLALDVVQPQGNDITILDIGTGGGNSIFALFELIGKNRIKALGVDISLQLLELCSKVANETYQLAPGTLELLCADLYDLKVQPETVDLVAGSSILHHMIDPAPIVRMALAALKPGGSAIFTEPFEDGHGLLMGAYRTALKLEPDMAEPVPDSLRSFMEETLRDFDARKGIGEIRDYTRHLDDKWYFARSWFDTIARQMNCELQILSSHSGNDTVFQDTFRVLANLHNGADVRDAPTWIHSIVAALDENFSLIQKQNFYFTGIVILTKRSEV